MKTAKLVVNESYWHLIEKKEVRTQDFLIPDPDFLIAENLSSLQYLQNLGILLKINDINKNSIYGTEIKTNGSSRSGRIPLVRMSEDNQSIWKVVSNIRDVDKAITDLDSLIYFLSKSRIDDSLELPTRVLVANFRETEYLEQPHLVEYVKRAVEKNNIVWVSSEFLANLFMKPKEVNVSELTGKKKTILTKEAFS